jgi:hypothetical protein
VQLKLKAKEISVLISEFLTGGQHGRVPIGYRIGRETIQHGIRLRLVRQRDGVTFGTLRPVHTVREENWGTAWGFSVYWDDYRKKNRHSLMFTEVDIEYFELVSASAADRPTIERIRRAKYSSPQLVVPFAEVALYRGTELVGTFEMLVD